MLCAAGSSCRENSICACRGAPVLSLAIRLGVLSIANLAFAFLLQSYVLVKLGPGVETDALFAGMTLPQLVLAVVSGSLMHVLVPLLSSDNDEQVRRDAWGFLTVVAAVFGAIAAVLWLTAQWWVPLTVPGFNEEGVRLTVLLTRIQLIGMTLTAVNSVQVATYHARQLFLWAEFSPVIAGAIAFVLLIYAAPRFGVVSIAWILVLRAALQTVFLARRLGRPMRPQLRSPAIRDAWRRVAPLLLGTTYYKSDLLVDRFLLSMADAGRLSLYSLALQLYGAGGQVLNRAVAAPAVPALSRLHKAFDVPSFRRLYNRRLLECGAVCLLFTALLVLIGRPALSLVFAHGRLDSDDVNVLWHMMLWLAGMFVGGALGQLSSASFFAIGDTRTPTRFGMYSYTAYIPLKLLLFHLFGFGGLAMATSAFVIVNFLFQDYSLRTGIFRARG